MFSVSRFRHWHEWHLYLAIRRPSILPAERPTSTLMTSQKLVICRSIASGLQIVVSVTGLPICAHHVGHRAAPSNASGSTLDPGQTARLPAIDTTPVPIRTERPLETACHIKSPRKAAGRCLGCRRSTARSRPANKVEGRVLTNTQIGKGFTEFVGEERINSHIRKALPLYEQHPLAETLEIREPNEVPFRYRSHIDQHSRRIGDERLPSLAHVDVSRIARIFVE